MRFPKDTLQGYRVLYVPPRAEECSPYHPRHLHQLLPLARLATYQGSHGSPYDVLILGLDIGTPSYEL